MTTIREREKHTLYAFHRLLQQMQSTGLEPEPTYVDMNLNHARMPIPPRLRFQ